VPDSFLIETTICLAGRTDIVLRHILFVTCACRYSIWMSILANNGYDVAVEDLTPALFTLMLTGPLIDLVDVTSRTLHVPSPI
jgi:hypothetical protein